MAQNVPGFKAVHKSYREIKFIHTSVITPYLDEKLEPRNHPTW